MIRRMSVHNEIRKIDSGLCFDNDLPHICISAHIRMGYPVCVWANMMPRMHMGVPCIELVLLLWVRWYYESPLQIFLIFRLCNTVVINNGHMHAYTCVTL